MNLENMNIPSKILIVSKVINYKEDAPQAYIVDPDNKKQIESARSWGTDYKYTGLYNQKDVFEPIEYYVDNEGFKLTIVDCAGTSSQGGKLSFWNCLIEKEPNIRVIVGIDQVNLLSLIRQSTIVNGTIKESLSLAKLSSTAGAVHKDMVEWSKSKQNKIIDKKGQKKTSKWEIGRNYTSLTKNTLYIGDLYNWVEQRTTYKEENTPGYYGVRKVAHYHLKFTDTPVKRHCVFELGSYISKDIVKDINENKIKSIESLYDKIIGQIRDTSKLRDTYDLCRKSIIFYDKENLITSLPSRYTGDIKLDSTNHINKLQELLTEFKCKAFELIKRTNSDPYNIIANSLGYSISPNQKPVITEEEKELILNLSSYTTHIDFGDGIEYTGKRG